MSDELPELSCPACGYSLRGLTAERCPECGEPFDRALLEAAARGQIPGTLPWDQFAYSQSLRTYAQTWRLVVFHPREFGRQIAPAPNLDRAFEFQTLTHLLLSSGVILSLALLLLLAALTSSPADLSGVETALNPLCCSWVVLLFGTWAAGAMFNFVLARLLARRTRPANVVNPRQFWSGCLAYASSHALIAAAGAAIAGVALLPGVPYAEAPIVAGLSLVGGALLLHAVAVVYIVAARCPRQPWAWLIALLSWLQALATLVVIPIGLLLAARLLRAW